MKNKQVTAEAWHVLFQAASLCWLYSGVGHIVSVKINCIYIYMSVKYVPVLHFYVPVGSFLVHCLQVWRGAGGWMRGVLMDKKKFCVNLCTHVLFSARLKCVTRINDHTCHCVSMCPVLILQWSSGNPCIAGAYCRLYAQLFCFFSFILLSLSCNYCCILLLFFIASTCT